MLGCLRWASVPWYKIEDWSEGLKDFVAPSKLSAIWQRYPSPLITVSEAVGQKSENELTLVFSVTTLDLLMNPFLNLSLQNPSSRRLVRTGDFEDMRGIDPVVRASSHYIVNLSSNSNDVLINWDLTQSVRALTAASRTVT